MHRTLKAEVASPPKEDWQAQQEALRTWRDEFNHQRPHEALNMRTPASQYECSPRKYVADVGDPEYPGHFEVRRVNTNGCIKMSGQVLVVGKVLDRECIGLEPIDDDLWHLWFGPIFLGRLRQVSRSKFHIQKESPRQTTQSPTSKVLPRSPV
jgi:hypothetical protein